MQSSSDTIAPIRAASSSLESLRPISGSRRARRTWERCLLLTIALVALLGATEFGLREVTGLGHPILYELNPAFGYFPQPNQSTRRLFARTATNRFGMRSPDFELQKPPGTLRLMFLGDSITYGTTQVDQGDIFAERIRKDLSYELHRPVEELNASASAWAISNEGGFLRTRGTYDSDYVLLVLNSGDLDQPFSKLGDVVGGQTQSPRSAISELFFRFGSWRRHVARRDAGTTIVNDPQTERTNLRELSSMAEFSRAQGSKFLLVFVPFRRAIATRAESSAQPALRDWAKSEGVELLDLTPAVSAHETKDITLRDQTHFNVLGNRLIAEALEKALTEELASGR